MSVDEQLFTMKTGKWYGWQMLPGYVSVSGYMPYFSPILMRAVEPKKTGRSVLQLTFSNALYAEGCQDFKVDLRIISRSENFLIGEMLEDAQTRHKRCAVICEISYEWLRQFCPGILSNHPNEATDRNVMAYLDQIFMNGDMEKTVR